MNFFEKQERNKNIITDILAGYSYKQVSIKYNISIGAIQGIMKQVNKIPSKIETKKKVFEKKINENKENQTKKLDEKTNDLKHILDKAIKDYDKLTDEVCKTQVIMKIIDWVKDVNVAMIKKS